VGLSPSALAQDEAIVNQLAGVLALEDARRFDPARFAEAARFPEPLVRGHAALAMGRIGDTTALPILVELLADEDSVVQEDAAFAMGLLGSTSALAPLRDRALLALRTGGRSSAVEGVTAIAMIGGANAASIIEEILRQASAAIQAGEESPVALRAVGETWRLGPDAPVAALVQIAQSGNAPFRRQAVYALTRLRAREGGTVIFNAARDSVAQIRAWAARTLTARYADSSGLGRDAVTSIVTQLVNDDDAGVRVNALRALATFEDSRLARVALDLTADPDFNVRFEVLMAVGRLAASESLAALTEALSGSLPALQAAALTSLARLDHNAALREAASWIIASDPRKRMVGADALGVIGGDTALTWLEMLLEDRDGRVVARAFAALKDGDSLWAREWAPELAVHPDPVVRTLAVGELAAAPLPAYLDALITSYDLAQGDLIPDARMAVVRALGRIAELGSLQEFAVGDQFLRRFPTCEDYLVRQVADEHLPAAARQWGPAFPVETGREIGDYRDIVRRLLLPAARGEEVPQLVIETDRGEIIVSLFAADAPLTVNAMLELADRRYFDAGRWHRVVPNFVIQDGDPRGDGWGGPGYVLRDEINRRRYGAGTVGMALSGPDTGGSQFFITHAPQPHLDGTYTVIGQVEQGNDIVGRIMQSDRIRTMRRR
jgi:cyclophilin family peptidyl-prolyl cis-trans isomerase/HEAT repeat protein